MMITQTISDTVSFEKQGWRRVVTYRMTKGLKVRATIYRDSYEFQSRIYTEVWNAKELRWNQIEVRPGTDYADLPTHYVVKGSVKAVNIATHDLLADLMAYAEEILG